MAAHNVDQELRQNRKRNVLTLSATTTLTMAQVMQYAVIDIAGQAVTLPTAAAATNGVEIRFVDTTGSGTVTGMGTGGTEAITLADGDLAIVLGAKNYWHSAHHTTAS